MGRIIYDGGITMKYMKIQVLPLNITYDYNYEIIDLEKISRIQKKINLANGNEYVIYLSGDTNGIRVTEAVGRKVLEMIGMQL